MKRIISLLVFLCSTLIMIEGYSQQKYKTWAKTPPMGWNSWDCYGSSVTEAEVKANTDYMASNLKPFGWEYIVVDIRWFVENDKAGGYNQTDPKYVIDKFGRYLPALNRFPSAAEGQGFKNLAKYIHGKGLKFGIHIMRGIPTLAVKEKMPIKGTKYTADQIYSTAMQCEWLKDNYTIDATKPGAQEYYDSIMELYASWGVDFIKIDDLSRPYHQGEIELIRKAIDKTGRPIVLSTSPGETPIEKATHVQQHANMWRMVDDVWDTWPHITHLIKVAQPWAPFIKPGTWPDCDMIPLGRISIRGERGGDRLSRLTKDEQQVLMTFFTIFRSPLMFGGDMPSLDPFTTSLLTNKAVLKMHAESTDVKFLFHDGEKVGVTSRNAKTGQRYVALFNLSDKTDQREVSVKLSDLGIKKLSEVTDLWAGKQVVNDGKQITVELKPHSCILYEVK
jgi:alpha-galactosidase